MVRAMMVSSSRKMRRWTISEGMCDLFSLLQTSKVRQQFYSISTSYFQRQISHFCAILFPNSCRWFSQSKRQVSCTQLVQLQGESSLLPLISPSRQMRQYLAVYSWLSLFVIDSLNQMSGWILSTLISTFFWLMFSSEYYYSRVLSLGLQSQIALCKGFQECPVFCIFSIQQTINPSQSLFGFALLEYNKLGMKKYGNISKYLANNSPLLEQNIQKQYNYDVIPTHRRNITERHATEQPPTHSRGYNQGLPRADTTQTQPYSNIKREWNQPRQQNSPYQIQREQEVSQKSRISQRVLNQRPRREGLSPQRHGKEIINEAEWRREMKNSISKLRDIKSNLEVQIKGLQQMLDESSKNIENMQKQFESIKFRVLEYTSRCLDNAFISYRQNMPRWSKYEEIEKKGLQLIVQLSDYIAEEEDTVAKVEARRVEINFTSSLRQTVSRMAHYGQMTQQIRKVKQQCLEKHPTLQEDRIAQFQNSLHQLCTF